MTKVSKVYLGLSRVSRALGRDDRGRGGGAGRVAARARAPRRSRCRPGATGRRRPGRGWCRASAAPGSQPVVCRHVVMSICRCVDLRRCRAVVGGVVVGVVGAIGGRVGDQGRVDGGAEPDLAAVDAAERSLELGPQPALDLGAGELVGHRDDGQVVVDGHRVAVRQPGPLVGLHVLEHRSPCVGQVGSVCSTRSVRLLPLGPAVGCWALRCDWLPCRVRRLSTVFSTGCAPRSHGVGETVGLLWRRAGEPPDRDTPRRAVGNLGEMRT